MLNCNPAAAAVAATLSPIAAGILAQVLEAMQPAEEMGGPEGPDYALLMEAISLEALQRIDNYRAAAATSRPASISDDDLCATCTHCEQGTDSAKCARGWPGRPDADGYIVSCVWFAQG